MISVIPGLLVVFLSVVVAIGGLALVQRLVPATRRKEHNDVAGFIYAVLGVAYAVLLGLMIIAVWEHFAEARNTVDQEATELAEIAWLAHQLPEPEGTRIQELARSYGEVVVEEEWPLMREGRSSPRAWALLDEIRLTIEDLDPRTDAEQALYLRALEQAHDLNDSRRDRLLDAKEGLPAILWVVLLLGGVIVVGFTYLFGLDNTVVHTLMVGALAAVIALALFTVGTLDYPFGWGVRVSPEAFELTLERFEQSKLSNLRE